MSDVPTPPKTPEPAPLTPKPSRPTSFTPEPVPATSDPGLSAAHLRLFQEDDPEVSKSYATALLNAAQAGPGLDPILDELDEFYHGVLGGHPKLAAIFTSPIVTSDQRDASLTRLLEGRISAVSLNFLRVLNRNGRFLMIGSILDRAHLLRDQRLNRRRVRVTSAVALDDTQRADLVQRLRALIGSDPVIAMEIDPDLLGGLIVQVGDTLYDASVRARLEQLHHSLLQRRSHDLIQG